MTFAVSVTPGNDTDLRPSAVGTFASDGSARVPAAGAFGVRPVAKRLLVDFLVSVPLLLASSLVYEWQRHLLQDASVLILFFVLHESPSGVDAGLQLLVASIVGFRQADRLNPATQSKAAPF